LRVEGVGFRVQGLRLTDISPIEISSIIFSMEKLRRSPDSGARQY